MSKKITELTALATPAATDLAVVVDMSGTPTTKKSTLAQLSTAIVIYGTTAGTVTQGNDSRLSDARTPLQAPVLKIVSLRG